MIASIPAGELPPPRPAAVAAGPRLAAATGGRVSFEPRDRLAYARDMWPKALIWIRQGRIPPPPDAVCWPANEDEVVRVIQIARSARLAVIPFGAGSGVCGGTVALEGGIALDLKRLEGVGAVDPIARAVDVEAGVLGETLERALNRQGWTLGHFPSSIYMSTLGGWLAARSAGQLSSKYGKIEDMVLSVRAVLGTAERVATPLRPYRGRDLAQLLVGSEGTLCAFTGARLRVHPLPEHRAFRGYRFKRVADGAEAIRQLFHAGLRPAVVRLYDPFDTALVGQRGGDRTVVPPSFRGAIQTALLPRLMRGVSAQALGRPWLLNQAAAALHHCLLVTLFEGERGRAGREDEQARAICARLGAEDQGEGPGLRWFEERYSVSYKMSKLVDSGAFADTMEVAATWDRVMDVYRAVRAAASRHAFVLCHLSHAYPEGCSLYFSFAASAADEAGQERRYDALWDAALGAARAAGATVSHHHGVGLLKGEALREELGAGFSLLADFKRACDPEGIMNPGKLGLAGGPVPPRAPAGPVLPELDARSGVLAADPSVSLESLEARANAAGWSLGPLSPGAMALDLRRFLRGPFGGLRAIRGGRLEPLALNLTAELPGGARYASHPSPRRAAGPDLDSLFRGAGDTSPGRLVGARLRLVPKPEVMRDELFVFPELAAALEALRAALADGCWFSNARLETDRLGVRILGSLESVERDVASLARRATAAGGRSAPAVPWRALPPEERELDWKSIPPALGPDGLSLYRLSLESMVARGAGSHGLSMET